MKEKLVGVAAMLAVSIAIGDRASASPVQFGSNYYEFVLADSISWADANAAASASVFGGVNGHLATVTSAAENNFLATGVADFTAFSDMPAPVLSWLGAQVSSSFVATWVVGPEAGQQFSFGQGPGVLPLNGMYTNWFGVEPNNGPSAMNMVVGSPAHLLPSLLGKWADSRNGLSSPCTEFCDPIVGYFVEYESPKAAPLPPSIVSQFTGLCLLCLLGWWRKRKRSVAT